ncbi:hypothetical protein [Vampirovibrio sp.]|uniref:hypothetical protein n=1 Tax=Vampirovibrio sp. TaxID=2717857 RepID=UPI00359338CC
MREQDKPEPTIYPSAPFCELPPIEGERRKEQDRRSMERQGKYDRRRNRCVHCLHFQEEAEAGKGLCQFHHVEMTAYAFACPNFDPLPPAEGRKL